jgi:DNA (cytosine-5)-methyltransferase 1
MRKLRVLDLFSGIGGFSLGLERTGGFETVAFCEIKEFPRKVLAKHWPEVPIYNDVRTAGPSEPVDLVTAGFPCQDISFAGKGAGLSGQRSGLFWHVIRTLCMVGRPRVLLENVAALLHRGMGSVLGALASFGYDAQWNCIQACDVGLPHVRDRLWIVADANGLRKLQQDWGIRDERGRAVYLIQEALRALPLSARSGSDDGLSARMDGLGNSVTPRIPEMIGRAILRSLENTQEQAA